MVQIIGGHTKTHQLPFLHLFQTKTTSQHRYKTRQKGHNSHSTHSYKNYTTIQDRHITSRPRKQKFPKFLQWSFVFGKIVNLYKQLQILRSTVKYIGSYINVDRKYKLTLCKLVTIINTRTNAALIRKSGISVCPPNNTLCTHYFHAVIHNWNWMAFPTSQFKLLPYK